MPLAKGDLPMRFFSLIVCVPVLLSAQIISDSSFLSLNQDICFSSGSISHNILTAGYNTGLYPCTTNTGNVDFSLQQQSVSVCICGCAAPVVSSSSPFYKSKKTFDSMDFASPLNLEDTSKFSKIDTIRNSNPYPGCFLPYDFIHWTTLIQQPESVLVIKTKTNKHVLIKGKAKVETYPTDRGELYCRGKSYFAGYTIQWYLQQDGTTDFKDIIKTRCRLKPTINKMFSTGPFSGKTYNILGQRIASNMKTRKFSRLRLINNNGNMSVQFYY